MGHSIKAESVLIVDDTPINIQVLVNALKDTYRVRVANGGLKALTIAGSEEPPDIILLDIMMPEVDGYEVCRRLKQNPKTMQIPVIFVTTRGSSDDEAFGLNLGAVDYISKPFSIPVVKARIRTHLQLKRTELEKSAVISELEKTLSEINTLRGLIPICSRCKKIRDDKGYWNTLESYIEKHSDASFSHSICEKCSDELYGDEDWYQEIKEK